MKRSSAMLTVVGLAASFSLFACAEPEEDAESRELPSREDPEPGAADDAPVAGQALQLAGAGPLSSIVSGAGKCLDVDVRNQFTLGTQLQVWDCNGTAQQTWRWLGGQILSAAGKCLDVHAPDQTKNGARVQIWDCNGSPQQQWRTDGERIVSSAGKCLDVHGPAQWTNGGLLQVWDCNWSQQQVWRTRTR